MHSLIQLMKIHERLSQIVSTYQSYPLIWRILITSYHCAAVGKTIKLSDLKLHGFQNRFFLLRDSGRKFNTDAPYLVGSKPRALGKFPLTLFLIVNGGDVSENQEKNSANAALLPPHNFFVCSETNRDRFSVRTNRRSNIPEARCFQVDVIVSLKS